MGKIVQESTALVGVKQYLIKHPSCCLLILVLRFNTKAKIIIQQQKNNFGNITKPNITRSYMGGLIATTVTATAVSVSFSSDYISFGILD